VKQHIKTFDKFISEKLTPDRDKGWFYVEKGELGMYNEDFFELIQTAYKPIGGHAKINSPEDITEGDWDIWKYKDVDNDDDPDVVRFASRRKWGIKSGGVGHDGSKAAKKAYLNNLYNDLVNANAFIEVSGKVSEILLSEDVPTISDPQKIEMVLGKNIKFHGKHPKKEVPGYGWYSRNIGGNDMIKILLGTPRI
jgi:hypothetical protein